MRKRLLQAVGGLTLAMGLAPGWVLADHHGADNYPDGVVTLIVPFTTGGSNDVLARTIGQKLSEDWGEAVVVENRPGAAGNIGGDAVAKADPDGQTLLIAANNLLTMNPHIYSNMPFDAQADFAPITVLGWVPVALVVNPNVPVNTVAELIEYAKANPGELNYASSGAGSPQHMSAELFKSMAGVDMLHVPYRGAAPAITDLLGGQVDVLFGPINSLLPHVRSGDLKALGVTGPEEIPQLPGVPPIADTVEGYNSDIWIGLVAPDGTPDAVIEKINQGVVAALQMEDVRKSLANQGITPDGTSVAEFQELLAADYERWGEVIEEADIRID